MEIKVGDIITNVKDFAEYKVSHIDSTADLISVQRQKNFTGTKIITRAELKTDYIKNPILSMDNGIKWWNTFPPTDILQYVEELTQSEIKFKDPFHSKKCECGSSKVYGENCPADHHSDFCPLYEGRK